jgi:hypothetical protein
MNSCDDRGQKSFARIPLNRAIHCGFDPALKGLSHEIFRPVFWPVWMHLGLNVNRLWFFYFKEVSLILYSYFKY